MKEPDLKLMVVHECFTGGNLKVHRGANEKSKLTPCTCKRNKLLTKLVPGFFRLE